MTLNVDYNLADGSWVRKALPEDWRKFGESDSDFAQRCGAIFQFDKGWSVSAKLNDVPADAPPAPDPLTVLQAQVALLQQQVAALKPATVIGK